MIRVFIGFDERQPVAFHVCAQSIMRHASAPVSIVPLILGTLPITRDGLTPFTFSRFLVPWLCNFEGRAIFMDSDFMARVDIRDLWEADTTCAVNIVQHPARSFEDASLMMFDCGQCKALTVDYVKHANSGELFGFKWAKSIGALPPAFNHLVSYDKPNPDAKLVHFTQGLPCYKDHPALYNAEHGAEWRAIAKECISAAPWETLMGASVHKPYVEKANAA